MGFAGYVGIKLTPVSITAPTIVLTLAIADSIHILVTQLGLMREGMDKIAALKESIRMNALAVTITSITTIVGFLSMNFSDAPPFHDLGNIISAELPRPMRVAYHDACHLAHAQRVRSEPRAVLAKVGNLELLEIPDGEICCGSAGTYNLEQPKIAQQLGARKASSIKGIDADAVATGNIGCITQLQSHLAESGQTLPVYHTMELLDLAYQS